MTHAALRPADWSIRYEPLVSDLIREVLGPDVLPDCWQGTIMPHDAVRERRIVNGRTYDWWGRAHETNSDYHRQFGRGYCIICQQGATI